MNYTEVAAKYIENGFSVIRIQTDGSKSPVGGWKPYQSRFASEHELREWFENGQPCGIGLVTGNVSGNYHLLDFDHESEEHYKAWCGEIERKLTTDSLDAVGKVLGLRFEVDNVG